MSKNFKFNPEMEWSLANSISVTQETHINICAVGNSDVRWSITRGDDLPDLPVIEASDVSPVFDKSLTLYAGERICFAGVGSATVEGA